MISVAAVGSASDAAAYYARDNYYTADQAEGVSAWAGEGAAELGLSGPVDAERFEQVLAGKLPNGVVWTPNEVNTGRVGTSPCPCPSRCRSWRLWAGTHGW